MFLVIIQCFGNLLTAQCMLNFLQGPVDSVLPWFFKINPEVVP